jgi:hypothetical protein
LPLVFRPQQPLPSQQSYIYLVPEIKGSPMARGRLLK